MVERPDSTFEDEVATAVCRPFRSLPPEPGGASVWAPASIWATAISLQRNDITFKGLYTKLQRDVASRTSTTYRKNLQIE